MVDRGHVNPGGAEDHDEARRATERAAEAGRSDALSENGKLDPSASSEDRANSGENLDQITVPSRHAHDPGKASRLELAMDAALDSGKIYFWEYDAATNIVSYDGNLEGEGRVLTSLVFGSPEWRSAKGRIPVATEEFDQLVTDSFLDTLVSGAKYDIEHRVHRPDGTTGWVNSLGFRVGGKTEGDPTLIVGVSIDVTGRKALEAELVSTIKEAMAARVDAEAAREEAVRAKEEAEAAREQAFAALREAEAAREDAVRAREKADAASTAKSEFLSRMSHELRTPLNAILGFGQLLQSDGLTEDQSENTAHIVKAGRHLLELINEVLDISRIEGGRLDMSVEPVDVVDLLSEVVDLMAPQAATKQITMEFDVNSCREYVMADQGRLTQVMMNLISNAVKYNRTGGSVKINCSQPNPETIRLLVSDTGIGIPEDKYDNVFVPFDRLGDDGSGVEGTGVGMALTKRLVEAMGGSIGLASVVGEGSTFWVDLRIALHPEGLLQSDPSVDARPLANRAIGVVNGTNGALNGAATVINGTVPLGGLSSAKQTLLYIEDNLANLKLVERILAKRADLEFLSAMQGSLGLDMARERHPDLLLLDLHLPDIDGDEILAELKSDPATADIPIVILSADATTARIESMLDSGAVAYVTKPINVAEFSEVVSGVLDSERSDAVGSGHREFPIEGNETSNGHTGTNGHTRIAVPEKAV